MPPTASGWSGFAPRAVSAPGRDVSQGGSGYALNIYGNGVPSVYGGWTTRIQGLAGGNYYRFRARALPIDIVSLRESITIVLRWRGGFGDEVRPDYVWDYVVQRDGSLLFDRVIQTPPSTSAVDVQLVLQWSPAGRVSFDGLSFTPAARPAPRTARVAAVYYRPAGTTTGADAVRKAAEYAGQVASTHQPDIMVLGEMLNSLAPGTLDSKAETVPGPSTEIMADVARGHGVNIAFGILEREDTRLYNTAVLLDRSGAIVGKYRKVQLPLEEASAGVTPGDSVPVFTIDVGRVALLICQDISFSEPAREAALQGAELLLVPIWGGKPALVQARAVEHGIYVAASGYDYASEVVGPLGTLASVGTSGPGAAIADIDLNQRFREIWLGDWRDISHKERRTSPFKTPSSPSSPPGEPPPPPPPDQTAPTVAITSPGSGATVSGSLNVAAAASDDVGVAHVRFMLDGAQLGADDTTAPYAVVWNTTTTADGAHTLVATAFDAAGNSASSSVAVNVQNGTTPPAAPVPGTIQAENYDTGGEGVAYHDTTSTNYGGQYRTDGVDIESTTDTGGGYDVGWMDPTEWLRYTVSVAAAGTYTLTARVASEGTGGKFHVEFGGANVSGALSIPNTGGWQRWTNVTATVTLAAGVQVMRVVIDSAGPGGIVGNLNYVKFDKVTPPGAPVPGTIQAEDYDTGGEGVAYHDLTPTNYGGKYRTDGVDIEATTDAGGGFNVGWIDPGEWLHYTVAVATAGKYVVTARVAAEGAGGTFHVEFGGQDVTGPMIIPNTGGWQSWTNVTATTTVSLAAGSQSMRVVIDRAGATGVVGNLNYVKLERVTP
jgi:predicted amidohydrolase